MKRSPDSLCYLRGSPSCIFSFFSSAVSLTLLLTPRSLAAELDSETGGVARDSRVLVLCAPYLRRAGTATIGKTKTVTVSHYVIRPDAYFTRSYLNLIRFHRSEYSYIGYIFDVDRSRRAYNGLTSTI